MNCSANRSTWLNIFFLALLAWLVVGCAQVPTGTPTPGETLPPENTPAVLETITPTTTQEVSSSKHLVLWVPPQFDPTAQGQAGALLAARLSEFEDLNPGVTIEVRLKAPSGAGGLLDALSATLAAAPLAAPAVVALPRADLESAALKGLIHPLDRLQSAIEDADWYPFARQLASIDGVVFGMPFGGDVMLLVYRPTQVLNLFKINGEGESIAAWQTLAGQAFPVIFPAASAQSLITLALYRSLDGAVVDANGRPMLDALLLAQVYDTYSQGVRNGAFPPWITTLENDSQAWQAFSEGRGNMLVTWSSSYLQNLPADAAAVPFGGMQSTSFSIADGWVWAVSDPSAERQELSEKLAEFLSQSEFVSTWSEALGMLPTRPSALASWNNQSLAAMLNQAALTAHLRPDMVVLTSLGPVLHDSVLDVLKQKSVPQDAATQAAQRLTLPNE